MAPIVCSTTMPASLYLAWPWLDSFDTVHEIAAPATTIGGTLDIITAAKSHPLEKAITKPSNKCGSKLYKLPNLEWKRIFELTIQNRHQITTIYNHIFAYKQNLYSLIRNTEDKFKSLDTNMLPMCFVALVKLIWASITIHKLTMMCL